MNNTYGAKLSKILLKNNIEIKLCYLQIGAIDVAVLDKLCYSFIEHTFFALTPSRHQLKQPLLVVGYDLLQHTVVAFGVVVGFQIIAKHLGKQLPKSRLKATSKLFDNLKSG